MDQAENDLCFAKEIFEKLNAAKYIGSLEQLSQAHPQLLGEDLVGVGRDCVCACVCPCVFEEAFVRACVFEHTGVYACALHAFVTFAGAVNL